tara:strand:- start:47 stop:328 length:282 start_codon:yes stop_codon:yes gene_type:complete
MEYNELIEDIIYYLDKNVEHYGNITAEENKYEISFFLEGLGDAVPGVIKQMEYIILDSGYDFHEIDMVSDHKDIIVNEWAMYEYEFVLIKNRF